MTVPNLADVFSANLERLRKENKLTQAELGKLIGTSQQNVGKYCNGTLPGLDVAVRIAQNLKVSLDSLVGVDSPTTISEMNTTYLLADLLRELVLIFDTLNFDVSMSNSPFSEKHLGFGYEELQVELTLFLEKWAKYRELLRNGDIQQEDYEVLLNARLNELSPLKVEKAEMLKKYVGILHENRLHRSK